MRYESLNKKGQEDFLMPILIQLLQNLGGKATREELKDELRNSNFDIEDAIDEVRISKKNGKPWKPFDFVFNFSIANLEFSGFLTCPKKSAQYLLIHAKYCQIVDNVQMLDNCLQKILWPIIHKFLYLSRSSFQSFLTPFYNQ